ncbi:MAG: hypothetical protein V3T83_07380 [Acidobacteriota bacterium]
MPSKKKPKSKPRPIQLKVSFEGRPEKEVEVDAYAFDRRGRFLASAPVKEGRADLELTDEQAGRARLIFGPPLRGDETPSLEKLERLNPYEAVWQFDPGLEAQQIQPFPEYNWKLWLACQCRVRGRVVRPVDIGGTSQDLPVCHVRVHICEVDRWPWLIAKLPDSLVLRVRDELFKELERPVRLKRPLPDPPPFRFDPGVIDPSPENLARMIQPAESRFALGLAFNPQPEPPAFSEIAEQVTGLTSESLQLEAGAEALGSQPEPTAALASLDAAIQSNLASNSITLVRQALVDQAKLIFPYLCYWPWFWYWLKCDEAAVLETDSQGRFDTTILYPCFGDRPDLYFWVEACIGGSWETVYHPAIACNTYWNYACGSEVTIRVTDPRVAVCEEPPDLAGLQVAVMSIGNGVSISEIQSSGAGQGLTTNDAPFGGRLEPHVWFGRSALIAAGVSHYRWSYRRRTNASGSPVVDSWHAMDRNVVRHYAMIDQTPPDFPLSFPAYTLGPDPAFSSQNLFQIQPVNVPVTPPPGSAISGWALLDAREDSASAFFMSHTLEGGNAFAAAGKYELKLELFDTTGSRVNLSDAGILLKEADQPAPFGAGTVSTIPAKNEHLLKDGSGKTVGFRIILRVDNNPCEANIHTVFGPGLTVDANCGFVQYSPGSNAVIRFKARHPNDFARFRFDIHRGPSIRVPEASAPAAGTASVATNPVNGFFRNAASVFTKSVPVNTLLTSNKPPASADCTQAAFAQTLYVWARATDGWHRLYHLDALGTPKAFALAPNP